MKRLHTLLIVSGIFSLLIIGGCSSLKITSDMDKSIDFNEIKTFEYYGWADDSDQILNRFDKERIENAFDEEFGKRGMSEVENSADVIVALYIVTEQKTQTTATTTGMGGGYGGYGYGGYYGYGPGYGWGSGMSTTSYNTYDYTVGTLVVSMFDAKKQILIWTSVGAGTIKENPDARAKNIPRVIQAIMGKYPVKPMK
ncbi:MAG: DUF4136 domain-containing protein [Bacteroidales bacterium]|nr:DUF4136 domain-containing protein [Bacteroidales bacterium]